jgi:hypothetical protein
VPCHLDYQIILRFACVPHNDHLFCLCCPYYRCANDMYFIFLAMN